MDSQQQPHTTPQTNLQPTEPVSLVQLDQIKISDWQ